MGFTQRSTNRVFLEPGSGLTWTLMKTTANRLPAQFAWNP
jgi:hypothetical protein